MQEFTVKIRPIAADEVAILEEHIAFDWAAPRKHIDRYMGQEKGEAVYLVAWKDELPVGHLLLKWQGTADEPMASDIENCPDLEDLFVNPDFRSSGIGTRLLECAEQAAKERSYARVGLGVSVDNHRAHSLYIRLGYRDTGYGQYTTGAAYIDKDGGEKTWTEVCDYLIKQLN